MVGAVSVIWEREELNYIGDTQLANCTATTDLGTRKFFVVSLDSYLLMVSNLCGSFSAFFFEEKNIQSNALKALLGKTKLESQPHQLLQAPSHRPAMVRITTATVDQRSGDYGSYIESKISGKR